MNLVIKYLELKEKALKNSTNRNVFSNIFFIDYCHEKELRRQSCQDETIPGQLNTFALPVRCGRLPLVPASDLQGLLQLSSDNDTLIRRSSIMTHDRLSH